MMTAKLFTWKWDDYRIDLIPDEYAITIIAHEQDTQVLNIRSTLFNNIGDITNPDTMADILEWVAAIATRMSTYGRERLDALAGDLREHKDMLDWWDCQHCGKKSFTVPDDPWICVWCGQKIGK